MRFLACLLACLLMLPAFGIERRPRKLMLGDKAPRLWASAWAGEPIREFSSGKIYLVSFWNKSVQPSVNSLNMLSRIQKRFTGKVSVVAFNVYSQERSEILTKKRRYANLTFAQDQLSEFSVYPTDGETGRAWLTAAGFSQTPAAFIVNEEGRVAWLGSTLFVESEMNRFMRRRPNLEAARKQYAVQIGMGRAWRQIQPLILAEINKKRYAKALEMIDLAIREGHGSPAYFMKIEVFARQKQHEKALAVYDEMMANPDMLEVAAINKIVFLNANMKDPKRAGKLLREFTRGLFKDDSNMLNGAAWALVDPRTGPKDVDLEAAYEAAMRSVKINRNGANVDTLARVVYLRGDPHRAAELQREAIRLGPPYFENEFQVRLAEYVERGKERMQGVGR